MKILFTGGSSFTGYHFISELSKNKKYKIFCSLQKKINTYKGIRYERIKLLSKKYWALIGKLLVISRAFNTSFVW